MILLIDKEAFEPYKDVTKNVSGTKLNTFILAAQQLDLEPLLGEDFLNDFLNNIADVKYQELLNGVGSFEGVKPVLVHYSYSRYVMSTNVTDTPFGLVNKSNEFSTQASEKTLIRMARQAESQGVWHWEKVKKFLDQNTSVYPLWKSNNKIKKGFANFNQIG
jgi:hypothetical protein